jgi:MauM/NapG family ferredoxin protein
MKTFSRRTFLRSLFGGTTRAGIGTGIVYGALEMRGSRTAPAGLRGNLGILRPPGAQVEAAFLSMCIRCTECADACPSQCILYFGPEAGPLQGTPYIEPADRGCTLCLDCGRACPSEALVALERKEDVSMGRAVVDERLCVSYNGTGVCGACHTACPLRNRAIVQDHRNRPLVDVEHCTGCGLCEEVCIVRDRRAIRVVSGRFELDGRHEEGRA